ncbi:hypothetical protein ACRE_083480 [Hapsidospora chrysogenum ATCC 11550]|uniref:Uncharacterized protein n=1 Tax=Hapsidospora chrysogenum (strain ATCC 11550 / CBS 779.69 / DSM 880 / IAM 14645 / JCM 23072 / IMI 49137) TaxID=857340 RepID=A0A086SV16_HAPC1|nr:hypothetical protein ACRE_083480 [Hapsidospora chrysogenum ATCC 11550]
MISKETPFFNDAFYRDPDVRYQYEIPFHEGPIQNAYKTVATTTKEGQTDKERAVICLGVISLEVWGLIGGLLKPEWIAVLARHRVLNPDVYFFWAYLVGPDMKTKPEPASAPITKDAGLESGPEVELEPPTLIITDEVDGEKNDCGGDISGPAAKLPKGEHSM